MKIKIFNNAAEALEYIVKSQRPLADEMYDAKTPEEFTKELAMTALPEEWVSVLAFAPDDGDIIAFDELIRLARAISPNPKPIRINPTRPGVVSFDAFNYQQLVDAIASLEFSDARVNKRTPQQAFDDMVVAINGARNMVAQMEQVVTVEAQKKLDPPTGQYIGPTDESNDPPDALDDEPTAYTPDADDEEPYASEYDTLREDFHELLARIASFNFNLHDDRLESGEVAQQQALARFAKEIHQKHFPSC